MAKIENDHHRQAMMPSRVILLSLVLLYAAPSLIALHVFHLQSDLYFPLTIPLIATLAAAAIQFRRRASSDPLGRKMRSLFSAVAAFNLFALVFLFEFRRRSFTDFSVGFALESGLSSISTVFLSYGYLRTLTLAGVLIGLLILFYFGYRFMVDRSIKSLRSTPVKAWHGPCVSVLLTIAALLWGRFAYTSVVNALGIRKALHSVQFNSTASAPARTSDSVVILHLESVNAHAIFQRDAGSVNGFRFKNPFPGIEAIWQAGRGVLFPFFWANSFATNRGVESILCGVSGNLDTGIVGDGKGRAGGKCLARELRNVGYKALYFYSFFDINFYNFDKFLPAMGFEDIIFGDKLMRDGDRRLPWGYDDCVFYDRLGEYFESHQELKTSPLFAYVEVSMHHSPFEADPHYKDVWPYPNPENLNQTYANSLSGQDHCLPRFMSALRKAAKKDMHVFVVGDHSIPLASSFDLEDRFMTTLLYLPPEKAQGGSKPMAVTTSSPPSQADIYATVIDLLYDIPSRYSFAPALRGEPYNAEGRCSLLANQYGVMAFARPNERARFSLDENRAVIETSVDETAGWTAAVPNLNFLEFHKKYACTGESDAAETTKSSK